MKKLFLALALLASPVVHAQTVAYSTQLNALARVVGAYRLSYYFCTYIDQAATTISATSYDATTSGGGRGARPVTLRATVTAIDLIDVNGNDIPVGTAAGNYTPVLPLGCYTLDIAGVGIGTDGQGAVITRVIVPYVIPAAPPPPPPGGNDD
jgi:hypothetical protein